MCEGSPVLQVSRSSARASLNTHACRLHVAAPSSTAPSVPCQNAAQHGCGAAAQHSAFLASPVTPPGTAHGSQEPAAHARASNTLGTARHRSAALDPASGPNTGTWDLGTSATLDLARLCGPLYRGTNQESPTGSSRSSRSPGLHCAWPEFCERASWHRALLFRFSALGGLRYVPWYLLMTERTQHSAFLASPVTPPGTAHGSQEPAAHARASNTLGTARHCSAALDPASGPNTGTWDLGTSATLDLARLCGPLYRGTNQESPSGSSRSSRSPGLHCAWPEFCERASCHRALLFRFSALGGLRYVPWYLLMTETRDGTGSTIEHFLRILEQVGRLGGWRDTELIGIGRCKMAGAAFDFAWRDENVAAAVTYSEFKTLALKRFDTEPISSKVEKFCNAKQNAGEEVRSFAERLRILGKATLGIVGGEDPAKTQLRREILEEELLSRFTAGLRDPVRRFVLSHEPRTFKEAVEVAAREEQIDKLCARSIRHGSDSAEERELQNRLDRLEKLTEKSLGLPQYELDTDVRRRCSTAPPTRCSDRGRFGHVARECVGRQLDPRNESPDCQSTVIKSVDEAVAGRLEKNSVAGHGEKKAFVMTVDICGEDVALEPVSDELEASVMQWQVEMLARDGYGGESGDEVSSSCETPQMPTPREKGSERDEVGEKPLEVMSESVAEIAPREDEVALGSPAEAREEIPPGIRESVDPLVSEREASWSFAGLTESGRNA
ncbi:hypothetical protein HPB50_021123 [Hyalomma asiaticum]|uniref:Uncharacterized protein n=1 Tax=Hyalomma asiaticum TaxID=266040 RepID=A0ACB7TDE3_HYAAI|nr:hypothetical protein HPB50_021123 [Hyalomma asiaticum]